MPLSGYSGGGSEAPRSPDSKSSDTEDPRSTPASRVFFVSRHQRPTGSVTVHDLAKHESGDSRFRGKYGVFYLVRPKPGKPPASVFRGTLHEDRAPPINDQISPIRTIAEYSANL